jgi:hypothetical protein
MASTINGTSTGNGGLISTGDDSGILNIQTNETNAISIDASQNVGIGTTTPTTYGASTKFAVVSSSTAKSWLVGGSASGAYYYFSNNAQTAETNTFQIGQGWGSGSDNIGFLNTNGANPMLFATNGTERMRIDSSGNLLVGVTSTFSPGGVPTTTSVSTGTAGNWALGIRHTSSASNPYGLAIQYPNSAPNAVSAQFIFCQDSAGTKFDVRSNGGIGNYSANNVNLSDQREKKNIELAGNYLNKICQIPVKTFLFNDQTDDELNLGAIAQEVQAVAPELVSESNWGTVDEPKMRLSIYQTDLQYALMKSIQELKAINDTQAETINALTARIVAIESRGTV